MQVVSSFPNPDIVVNTAFLINETSFENRDNKSPLGWWLKKLRSDLIKLPNNLSCISKTIFWPTHVMIKVSQYEAAPFMINDARMQPPKSIRFELSLLWRIKSNAGLRKYGKVAVAIAAISMQKNALYN
jgi:hypothetical protein